MIHETSPITLAGVGDSSLSELQSAVSRAQSDDPFTRVVVIADHFDAATALRHHLGASGMMNVTVQTGRRLAAELAAPVLRSRGLKPLTWLLERQAVRAVAEDSVGRYGFDSQGGRLMRNSLAAAFRRMQESTPEDDPGDGSAMNTLAERLLKDFLRLVHRRGYYTAAEVSEMAAEAVSKGHHASRRLPQVIYYLPRRLSTGDLQLAKALLDRSMCDVILGLTGDGEADEPVHDLLGRLTEQDVPAPATASSLQRLAEGGSLSIVAAPDPEEEVRTVVRSIVAGDLPFHRTAVIYRQDNPYASLLRQALDIAGVPYSGTERRTLAHTPSGLLLLGLVDMASNLGGEGAVERERFIEWMTSTPVRNTAVSDEDGELSQMVPASQWARLSRQARTGGSPDLWESRLDAHACQEEARYLEREEEIPDRVQEERIRANELCRFVSALSQSLGDLVESGGTWRSASAKLKRLLISYRWVVRDESPEDRRRIDEFLDSLEGLDEWDAPFGPQELRQVVQEGLQSPVSDRGRPVGSGVYLGPLAGIAGADYARVYVVGMVEKQFPPRAITSPWLGASSSIAQKEMALERYDFLSAMSAAGSAVLNWPAATAERAASYPSRWLIEAANVLHGNAAGDERLTYETITQDAGDKPWLTFVASREAGLRHIAGADMNPADASDYNLSHMIGLSHEHVEQHPAIADDPRMVGALRAGDARSGDLLSEWDGLVGPGSPRLEDVGTADSPISPSALETLANCPYRYFLGRVLGISAPVDDNDSELSNMDRGLLVHKILERFVKDEGTTEEELLAIAEEEFDRSEERGATGYHLLWEIEKEEIREGLRRFLAAEGAWLGGTPERSDAEVSFGEDPGAISVSIELEGLGEVHFRGKIDRVDALGDEVRVRDFKTGRAGLRYRVKSSVGESRTAVSPTAAHCSSRFTWKRPRSCILASRSRPRTASRFTKNTFTTSAHIPRKTGSGFGSRLGSSWEWSGRGCSPQLRSRATGTSGEGTATTAISRSCARCASARYGSARAGSIPGPRRSTNWVIRHQWRTTKMKTADKQTLHRIVNDLSTNLIIEAGAGTGKTYALVSRVVALVKSGARMRDIVAITFTEAAAAELSERVRSRLEQLLDENNTQNDQDLIAKDLTGEDRKRLERAVSELDEASVQTIHSFAAQLLRERPLDAGLPPGWMNLDEIADSERFNERWDGWLETTLARDADISTELAASLRYLAETEGDTGKWKTVAQAICEDLHRLPGSGGVVESGLGSVVDSTLEALSELAGECSNTSDRLYGQLIGAIQTVEAVGEVADDPGTAVRALESGDRVTPYGTVGSKGSWGRTPKEVRDEFREVGEALRTAIKFAPLAPLLNGLGRFARDSESARRRDGEANFRDLLTWARDTIRDRPDARSYFQRRYSHILIDEFQDTDPLQAEIAFYLAAETDADVNDHPWHTLPLAPGKLFVVG